VSAHMMPLIIGMAAEPTDDPLTQMLTELARSTARLREMADEAHALVQDLQHRPLPVSVKKWANDTKPSHSVALLTR
jgi:hypothetical protein